MKKFFSLLLMSVFIFNVANAQTKVIIGIAGDTYYATDNDRGVDLEERPLTNTNVFKDRFGTNNVLLYANAKNDNWRANVAVATFGELIQPEEANIGLRLYEGLWITGGVFVIWDDDYTFNKWFTGNSLTDLRNMGTPYVAWGLEYAFTDDLKFGVGLMNTGVHNLFDYRNNISVNADNNRSKTIYTKLDWNNLYKDWNLVLSFLTGNEAAYYYYYNNHINVTEVYASIGGTIIDKLEGKISGKFFRDAIDDDDADAFNSITFQALLRYRFHDKFAAGFRFSYLTSDEPDLTFYYPYFIKKDSKSSGIDLGIVVEYNPVPYAYLRLEGGMLSLSNSKYDDMAKVFGPDDDRVSSRMGAALSMGFKFGLFQTDIR